MMSFSIFELIHRYKYFFIYTTLLLCCAWLIYTPFLGEDIWWHLKLGKDIIENRVIDNVDYFTYTINGKVFVVHSWLSDCLFYLIYNGNEVYLHWFRYSLFILYFSVVFAFARKYIKEKYWHPILLFIAIYSIYDYTLRPYLFPPILALLILCTINVKDTYRRYLVKLVLLLIWSNLHPSFLYGFALCVITELLTTIKYKISIISFLWFLLLSLVVCFCQPNFMDGLIYPFHAIQFPTLDWYSWFDKNNYLSPSANVYFMYIITLITLFLSGYQSLIVKRDNFSIVAFLSAFCIFLFSLLANRFLWILVHVVILNLITITGTLEYYRFFPYKNVMEGKNTTVLLLFFIILFSCMKNRNYDPNISEPDNVINFMNETGIKGNLFSFLPWSGKIIFNCKNIKVFIDTRIEPFVPDIYTDYMQVIYESDQTEEILKNTDMILMPNIIFRPARINLNDDWIRVWISENETLYLKINNENQENMVNIQKYYLNKGIDLVLEEGLSLDSIITSNLRWAMDNEVIKDRKKLQTINFLIKSKMDSNKNNKLGIYKELGYLYLNSNIYSESINNFEEALKIESEDNDTEMSLAQSYFLAGKDYYGFETLRNILQKNPYDKKVINLWEKLANANEEKINIIKNINKKLIKNI